MRRRRRKRRRRKRERRFSCRDAAAEGKIKGEQEGGRGGHRWTE